MLTDQELRSKSLKTLKGAKSSAMCGWTKAHKQLLSTTNGKVCLILFIIPAINGPLRWSEAGVGLRSPAGITTVTITITFQAGWMEAFSYDRRKEVNEALLYYTALISTDGSILPPRPRPSGARARSITCSSDVSCRQVHSY